MSAGIYLTFLCTFIALQVNSGFKVSLDAKKRAIENTAIADAILYAYRIDKDAPNFLNRGDLIFNVDKSKDVSILHNSEMQTTFRYSDSDKTAAKNIAASMKVEGSFGAFSGAASMEVSSSSNKNVKTIRIDSMIKSVMYEVSSQGAFRTFPEQFLTENFKNSVKLLSVEQIAERIGIFFATKLDLGGEIMKSYTMQATEEDTELSVTAELQAEYDNGLMGASVEASGSYTNRKSNKESQMKISWSAQGGQTTIWLGRTFSDKGSNSVASIQQEWAKSITDRNMYPTNFELRPLWEMVKAVDAKKGAEFEKYLRTKWEFEATFKPKEFLKSQGSNCGSIVHVSGKCIHPYDGGENSQPGTHLVFHDGCYQKRLEFCWTAQGDLKHTLSGLCVQPAVNNGGLNHPGGNTALILGSNCGTSYTKFKNTKLWLTGDSRCGPGFQIPTIDYHGHGTTMSAQCNPNHKDGFHCCSPGGWCGNTPAHCKCAGCIEYKNPKDTGLSIQQISSGMCIHPKEGGWNPDNGKWAVLWASCNWQTTKLTLRKK